MNIVIAEQGDETCHWLSEPSMLVVHVVTLLSREMCVGGRV